MSEPGASLPKGKPTALGLYVTAKEGYEQWKAARPDDTLMAMFRSGGRSAMAVDQRGRNSNPDLMWENT